MSEKQVRDGFIDELFALADGEVGEPHDERHKNWAKRIHKVNPRGQDGYAFWGPFVGEGTVDVELKPTVFLVATARGSCKYPLTKYHVVTMNVEGKLELTDITATDYKPGWAVRLRDKMIDLLAEMAGEDEALGVPRSLRDAISALSPSQARIALQGVAGGESLAEAIEIALTYE